MTDLIEPDECEILRQLRKSEPIFALLDQADVTELQLQARLRRDYSESVVRAALTLHGLRKKAAGKFSRSEQMWFDRKGFQQATSEAVAQHKAARFGGLVHDYCCGIGGDTIALAERCDVVAVDNNPLPLLCTEWNAEVYDVSRRVKTMCADVETLRDRDGLLHIDPDRRPESHGRVIRVEDSVPDLDALRRMIDEFSGGAIKLSPAGNFIGKFPDAEIELISLRGECKEATVWFGQLAEAGCWRATVLPDGATLAGDPLDAFVEPGALQNYLYDPDPAVVRAGLTPMLAEEAGLTRLDDAEEYLTSNEPIESPFVRAFEVLADLPNNSREIRAFFRKGNFGQVEIKCRHIPIDAEAVRRKLPLGGNEAAVLIFARVRGKSRAIVCRRH